MRGGLSSQGFGRSVAVNFLLVFSSIAASVLLAEGAVRVFAPQPMSGVAFEYGPRGYPVNKSSGTALFNVGESKGIYHFTPPHLRGIGQPPAGAERILVLGDSYTFGVGLSEEDTYVARLQNKVDTVFGPSRIALLNAGIPGSRTADQLAFLEDYGNDINPRMVFVFVSTYDFSPAQQSPLYHLRSSDGLELDEGTVPISSLKRFVNSDLYNFLIQHMQIAQLLRRAVIGVVIRPEAMETPKSTGDTSPDQQQLARALFRRMKVWCDAHRAKLAVITNGWRQYDWLPKLLSSESISAFDSAPQVRSVIAPDPAPFVIKGDGHPNAKGAAVTVEAVWPYIETFIRENK